MLFGSLRRCRSLEWTAQSKATQILSNVALTGESFYVLQYALWVAAALQIIGMDGTK
jgi:hypothetical protein